MHKLLKPSLGRCAAGVPTGGGPAPVLLDLDAMQCRAFFILYFVSSLYLCLQGMSSSPRPLLQQASSFRRQSSMRRTSSAAESQSSAAEQSLAARGLPAVYDPNGEDLSAVVSTPSESTVSAGRLAVTQVGCGALLRQSSAQGRGKGL